MGPQKIKELSGCSRRSGDHLSSPGVTTRVKRPTRGLGRASFGPSIRSCSRWGLPSRLVTQPLVSSCLTISPLPALAINFRHLIIKTHISCSLIASRWRYVSVALSVGSPLLGVTQHPARWSSDFPPARSGRSPGLLDPPTL